MPYEVRNHILFKDGKQVAQKPSPNRGGKIVPRFLIMHYTGGVSTQGAINTLTNAATKVSAHFVLSPEGEVTQLLPCNVVGWHAGESKWGKVVGLNSCSVGIEMVNPGLLARSGTGGFVSRLENKPWPAKQTIIATHKNGRGGEQPWAVYPQAQVDAAADIARAIVTAYGIKEILGHDDIALFRKIDPGPAFHMEPFRARVFGRA